MRAGQWPCARERANEDALALPSMLSSPTRRGRSPSALIALLLGCLSACARDPLAPAEVARLGAPPPGTLPPLYTLADETRPVLALPPERRVDLIVPPNPGTTHAFALPAGLPDGIIIATGSIRRANRVTPLPPQLLITATDQAGTRLGTLTLPAAAQGPGPESALALTLTTPQTGTSEIRVAGPVIPPEAKLTFAFGLSEAALLPGSGALTFELAARTAEGSEVSLWSIALTPAAGMLPRWNEATVGLRKLAGQRVDFVFRGRPQGGERPAVGPLWSDPTVVAPRRRPPTRRNVILISIDTLRADRVGVYGAYRPTTPILDALASEAVVFSDAWAVWPETSGSHMSLFTSRYPSEHGVTSFISAPPPALELLAERLRREGYLTRAFTEDGGVWAYAGFARGFSAYGERRSPDFIYRGEAAATFADATRWVQSHADRTFFLFVHTYQVHAPYTPPEGYRDLFADVPGREPDDGAAQALAYDREVRFTDDQLGRFLDALRRLGVAERSIVIVTSDHGEEFREHGGMGHGRTLHREVLQVPLVLWAPGLLAPARVVAPATLLDVAPTLLELLGLAADPTHRGTSLAAAARAAAHDGRPPDDLARRPIFGEVDRTEKVRFHMASVRRGGRSAITDLADAQTRCYGADDPGEQRPSAECPDLVALVDQHRASALPLGAQTAPLADQRLIEKMRALGYLQ